MDNDKQNIIIYNTPDGNASVSLYAKDGMVWMNQNQLAKLFDTSIPNISMHISNILKEGELEENSVIKDYLTTASDEKKYNVTFYSLEVILAFNEKPLLTGKGKISNAAMEDKVREIYQLFDKKRKIYEAKQADKEDLAELMRLEKQINNGDGKIENG